MSREQDNKVIVGRWFTEFWGNTWNPAIVDELCTADIFLRYGVAATRLQRRSVIQWRTWWAHFEFTRPVGAGRRAAQSAASYAAHAADARRTAASTLIPNTSCDAFALCGRSPCGEYTLLKASWESRREEKKGQPGVPSWPFEARRI